MIAHAQEGDEGTCPRCNRKIEFRLMGYDYATGAPIYRWAAVRKTKNAPNRFTCPNHNTKGYHRTDSHSATGAPLPVQS